MSHDHRRNQSYSGGDDNSSSMRVRNKNDIKDLKTNS